MHNPNFDFEEFQEEISEKFQMILESSYLEPEDEQEDPLDAELTPEAENTYNKIKMILNTPEMEKAHPFCFGLRHECVSECDRKKIDDLFKLGVDRGFIQEEKPEEISEDGLDGCDPDDPLCGGPDDSIHFQDMNSPLEQEPVQQQSAYTVLYSAIKDGQVKVGEFYSNAVDNPGAIEDCINNLTQVGYSNIRVIGTEQNNLAVNTDVQQMAGNEEPIDILGGDAEEFEKQETGDMEPPPEEPSPEPEPEPEPNPKPEPKPEPEPVTDKPDSPEEKNEPEEKPQEKPEEKKNSDDSSGDEDNENDKKDK